MDGDQFDRITRLLAHNVSRRSVVRGLSALVAGTAVAARPLSGNAAKGGPNPCNVYCAGESGSRGAQCRQACKDCGGPDSAGFCYDPQVRGYTCCPDSLGCFDAWTYPGGETVICCAGAEQVCSRSGGSFCCEDGTHCAYDNLCCPLGVDICFDPGVEDYVCGASCRDTCLGYNEICGEPNDAGYCAANSCFNPCSQEYACGEPDELGNCSVETCFDVCSQQTVCGTPNSRGNCQWGPVCYDPCNNVDRCDYPNMNDFCPNTACYDPEQGTHVCGTNCFDICTNQDRCGSSEGNPWGYCVDTFCFASNGGFSCGTPDVDGNCIV